MSAKDPWEDVTPWDWIRKAVVVVPTIVIMIAITLWIFQTYDEQILGALRWLGLPVVEKIDW